MNDLINRQAAIDAICKHGTDLERRGITVLSVANHKQATVDLLENLPSAERLGRWVDEKRIGLDGTFHWFRQCSECLYEREDSNEDKDTPYCPNCGAKMDEVEE